MKGRVSGCTVVSQAPATSASPCPLPPQPRPASLSCLEAEDQLLLAAGVESHPGPFTCPLCSKYMTEVKQNLVRHKKHSCPMRVQQQENQPARRASKRLQPEEVRSSPPGPSFKTKPPVIYFSSPTSPSGPLSSTCIAFPCTCPWRCHYSGHCRTHNHSSTSASLSDHVGAK